MAAVGAVVLLLGFPSAASAETGRQTFRFVQTTGEEEARVIASGPIRGVGRDVIIEETETEDGFTSEDQFVFADGSVFVTISGPEVDFSFDPRTCVGRVSGPVEYVITGGTGRYEGASGSGTGSFRVVFVAGRNADRTCSEDEEDEVASFFTATLTGTTTLPGTGSAAA